MLSKIWKLITIFITAALLINIIAFAAEKQIDEQNSLTTLSQEDIEIINNMEILEIIDMLEELEMVDKIDEIEATDNAMEEDEDDV